VPQKKERFKGWLAICLALLFLPIASAFAKEPELTVEEKEPVLSGRVTDAANQPLKNAQVLLTIPNSTFRAAQMTKADGNFALPHEPATLCHLEVLPPKDSGLASALLDHIPGEATRRVVIQLKPGLSIKGKLTGDGKGLKGLKILIEPVQEKDKSVHANGWAKTGNNGEFEVTVIPGMKRFTVTNTRYEEFVASYHTDLKITESGAIPDIALPPIVKTKTKTH
jgi:hypothetical protein